MIAESLRFIETGKTTEIHDIDLLHAKSIKPINKHFRTNKTKHLLPAIYVYDKCFDKLDMLIATHDNEVINELCNEHAFIKLRGSDDYINFDTFISMCKLNHNKIEEKDENGYHYKDYIIENEYNEVEVAISFVDIITKEESKQMLYGISLNIKNK